MNTTCCASCCCAYYLLVAPTAAAAAGGRIALPATAAAAARDTLTGYTGVISSMTDWLFSGRRCGLQELPRKDEDDEKKGRNAYVQKRKPDFSQF